MPHVQINGHRFFYRDTGGGGLPVVLSHGWLMDADMFEPQVAALSDPHRVITWDQRGHGRTESERLQPHTYWDSADDLAGLLDHLEIERAVVGGMSQGGFISLRFALRYPQRTLALVLIDSQAGLEVAEKLPEYDLMHQVWVGDGPNDQLAEMVAAIIIGSGRPESRAWIAKWLARPPESVTPIYRTLMDRDDVTDRLSEITVPALVIHGEEDIAIGMDRAEQLCAGLPGCAGVVRIPGAGHASNLTHPEPVNQAIRSFLESIGR